MNTQDLKLLKGIAEILRNFKIKSVEDYKLYEELCKVFNNADFEATHKRVPKGQPNGGQFCGDNKTNYSSYNDLVNDFSEFIEKLPDDYKINDAELAKKDLGVTEEKPRIIKTPIEELELRADRVEHIINGGGDGHEPDKTRYKCINKMFATLERPNIIIEYENNNKGYFKIFQGLDKTKNQIVSIHRDEKGDFIYTAMPSDKGSNYFLNQINKGKILYKKGSRS